MTTSTNGYILAKYYSREDIQKELLEHAKDKEVVGRFPNMSFAKRPDVLLEKNDIIELYKQGVVSFQCSEELWQNPLRLRTGLSKKELQNLRIGWDFILDIDCPVWEFSKILTFLLIKAMRSFGVQSISVKFSGNKGFHIGVPFESFPKTYKNKLVKDLFPEAPRAIASFLVNFVSENYVKVDEQNNVLFGDIRYKLEDLQKMFNVGIEELTIKTCARCKKVIKDEDTGEENEFVCRICGAVEKCKEEFMQCKKCHVLMEKISVKKIFCECGSSSFVRKFDAKSIIEVDTILISSRHLYRMPYSYHEKSGYVSLPINPDKVLEFDKKSSSPEIVEVSEFVFLDRKKAKKNEMLQLLDAAFEYELSKNIDYVEKKDFDEKEVEKIAYAVPKDYFPPCIKMVLAGMKDGRKRSLFILLNFLRCVGWNYDKITEELQEWNKRNLEPLTQTILIGQTNYHKRNKKLILPPNCDNKMYYRDIGICQPDNLCARIKNPVQYTLKKSRFYLNEKIKQKNEKEKIEP